MTTPRYNVKMPRHHEHNEDIYINSVIVTDYNEIVLRKLSGDAIFNTKGVPQCVARGHDDTALQCYGDTTPQICGSDAYNYISTSIFWPSFCLRRDCVSMFQILFVLPRNGNLRGDICRLVLLVLDA